MNSREREKNLFVDGELSRMLRRWVAGARQPGGEARRTLLQRAAALQGLGRAGAWMGWRLSLGLITPEQHRASTSYLMMTFQTANLRLVI